VESCNGTNCEAPAIPTPPQRIDPRQLFAPGADAVLRLYLLAGVGGLLAIGLLLFGLSHFNYVGIAPA